MGTIQVWTGQIEPLIIRLPHQMAALAIVEALAACPLSDIERLLHLREQAIALIAPTKRTTHLTPRERDALATLRHLNNPYGQRVIKTRALAAELLVDDSWAYRLLANLRDKGYVERVGSRKTGGWRIIASQAIAA